MAKFRVDGYKLDGEEVEADYFTQTGDQWLDFLTDDRDSGRTVTTLRLRAEHVQRIELVKEDA